MTNYLIFGPGRVGTSMASYLKHLGQSVVLIGRSDAENSQDHCAALIQEADVIGVAIPDDNLSAWYDHWAGAVSHKTVIHFSGALTIDGMKSFHPLYSFPKTMLPVEEMKKIAFACPIDGPKFKVVFPTASNPHFELADEDRARYHALAVLTGNLASYIWNEAAHDISTLTSEPPEKIFESYLRGVVDRFVESPMSSLTGPIARKDVLTVEKNLDGLADNPKLKRLYDAFLETAWPEYQSAIPNADQTEGSDTE